MKLSIVILALLSASAIHVKQEKKHKFINYTGGQMYQDDLKDYKFSDIK